MDVNSTPLVGCLVERGERAGPEYFASGGFDSEDAARDAYPESEVAEGETDEHTFEVEGTYGYFCIPHE